MDAHAISLDDEDATRRLAEDIAAILRAGDVLALSGDLGAGKTTFARFLLRALFDDPGLEVPSPTFTLAQPYLTGRIAVTHYDFYRLQGDDEVDELGFEAAIEDGAAIVEWPNRAARRIPPTALWIALEIAGPQARTASLTTRVPQAWRDRLDRTRAIRGFLASHGHGHSSRRHLTGDASFRAYERIRRDGSTLVLMNAPERPDGPPVRDGLPYSRIAHLAESVRSFVAIAGTLGAKGFSAPEVLAADLDRGLLLLEDLGSEPVVAGDAPIVERYEAAVDVLAAMHGLAWPDRAALPDGSDYRLPLYDEGAYLIEADLYPDWYVPHVTGKPAAPAAKAEFVRLWGELVGALDDAATGWVLRDYHSPNLIWLAARSGLQRVGIIDFQDALIGPNAYDVASLCQDARVTIGADMEASLMTRYTVGRAAADPGFDDVAFRRHYAILAAQRATKILGIFARLNDRDGKPGYLRHIPRINEYLTRSLTHPALSGVKHWYESNAPAG